MREPVVKLAFAIVLAGCIQIPEAPTPQCTVDADCQTAIGEVCNEGACYGGPPNGMFAAIVTSPSDRSDLISVEIPSVLLASNGDLGSFELEAPVTINGRVEPFCDSGCTDNSLAATILVTRAPLFVGGSGFSTTATSKDGLPRGSNSFSIAVPRWHTGDPPYVVTVVPSGNGLLPPSNGAQSAAEVAPPTSFTISPSIDMDTGTIVLSNAQSPIMMGILTDGANHLLTKYRVVARGRLTMDGAVTDVSSVAYTTDGSYRLILSDAAIAPISIVATSYDSNVVAPTLTISGLDAKATTRTLAQPAASGGKVAVPVSIEGLGGDGSVNPVAGAQVLVQTEVDPSQHDDASATVSVSATTDENGMATLQLLDGVSFATGYKLRVIPPVNSELGVVFDAAFDITDTTPVRLPSRVALRGHLINADGTPGGKITVTAQPSLRFSWSVPASASAFLSEIPAPTSLSSAAGDFLIYVDLALAGVWGHYDLSYDAPNASFTDPDIELPREANLTALSLPDTIQPATAYLHGTITDPAHANVSGGELRIFQIASDTSLCGEVMYPPATCVIPAQLLGHAASDDDGTLKLGLPRQ